ncbi:MAG TPA: hypothetical protein VIM47_00805 [Dermatophilaceae bacterium]
MSACVKVTYPTEKAAKTALVGIVISNNRGHFHRSEPHRERRPYKCPHCWGWHLTSERKNTPGTQTTGGPSTCRPVEVDGEVIRVLGDKPMDTEAQAAFAEVVRAAKHLMTVRSCPDCEQGKHTNCTGEAWDNDADAPTVCPCSLNRAGPPHHG